MTDFEIYTIITSFDNKIYFKVSLSYKVQI